MSHNGKGRLKNEDGYSLLALVLVLAAMAIFLTSSIDTFHMEVMREKEEEFLFRGQEIAKAIARYNNAGRLGPLRPGPFPTKIPDLAKEVNLNGVKLVFLRKFALLDPISGRDWKPVRAGDPIIAEYFQKWSAYYAQPIPAEYLQLIGGVNLEGGSGSGLNNDDDDDEDEDEEEDEDEDEDDEEDDDSGKSLTNNTNAQTPGISISAVLGRPVSPSESTAGGGLSSLDENQRPIIGVVSRSKLKAYRRLLGKDVTYDKWLFIYLPIQQGGVFFPGTEKNVPLTGNVQNDGKTDGASNNNYDDEDDED